MKTHREVPARAYFSVEAESTQTMCRNTKCSKAAEAKFTVAIDVDKLTYTGSIPVCLDCLAGYIRAFKEQTAEATENQSIHGFKDPPLSTGTNFGGILGRKP